MTLRVQWDKQETAIIIDAYLRVKNKELTEKDAIKEVSLLLRCRAKQSGLEIDDVFRNINGITMQMKIIGSLIDETPSGLHSPSKMFEDMVSLYKNNPQEFNKILIQAKVECTTQVSAKESFFSWLKARVSSTQISDLYYACKDLESYCMKKQIITNSLFETADIVIVQQVIKVIKLNSMFRFKHFRQIGKMLKMMNYYMKFLEEISINEKTKNVFASKAKHERVLEEYNSIECNVKKVENEEEVTNEVTDNESAVWNFANDDIDFSNISPTSISYFDEVEKVQSWADAFVKIVCVLQEDYPSIIRGLVGYRFVDVGKVIFTGSIGIDRLSKPVEVNHGLCLETDCTPNEIVSIVRLLVNKCNVDYENIEMFYEESKNDIVVNENWYIKRYKDDTTSIDERHPEEPNVYNQNLSTKGVQDYIVQELNNFNILYVDNRDKNGRLWITGDRELSSFFEKFNAYNATFYYMEDCGRGIMGEHVWWTKDVIHIGNKSKNNDTENRQIKENEQTFENTVGITSVAIEKVAFEKWLINNAAVTERSAKSYSSVLDVASQYAIRCGFSTKDLFCILDAEQVHKISMKLLSNPEFAQIDDEQYNLYRAALSKYCDYCKATLGATTETVPTINTFKQTDEIKKTWIEFIEWAKTQNMQPTVIPEYLSAIQICSEFAMEHKYIHEQHLLVIRDVNTLERVFIEMRKDSGFVELSKGSRLDPVLAMNKLLSFRNAINNDKQKSFGFVSSIPMEESVCKTSVSKSVNTVDPQVKERYIAILAKNFEGGFRPEKAMDRNRFRMYYEEMFGDELKEDNEHLVKILNEIGTLRNERIFIKDDTEQIELLKEINDTITQTFNEGASCIFFECLFTRFQEPLAEILHIYTSESLEKELLSLEEKKYLKKYKYLYLNNREPSHKNDVIEYMKKFYLPVTLSKIGKELWYIPLDKIKSTLTTTESIVNVSTGAYLYAPNLPFSESEICQIERLISRALLQRKYVSEAELKQMIEQYCPSVLMNTSDYHSWGIRKALAYIMRDKFSFRGPIISEKDEEFRMTEVFSDFCQRSDRLTVDELKQFATELNTNIYWESVYSEMVRINQDDFVRKDHIHFDIERIDSVLDMLIQNEYAPIKSINLFLHFPTIDVPWNNFVLESYVSNYSQKFILLHASYSQTDSYGAVVRRNSSISDYRTLVLDVLMKNTGWNNEKDALQLLVDLGYQKNKSFRDIEQVMQEAKLQTQKE